MNGDLLGLLALGGSAIAIVISIFSWRAAVHANRAALFERRFEIYNNAEEFIDSWMREAKPDVEKLGVLFYAWNRSHFLFEPEVTAYLQKLYLDAIKADQCEKIVAGEAPGNRVEALKKMHALTRKHTEFTNVREIFLPHRKVSDGYLSFPKWAHRLRQAFTLPKNPWSNEQTASELGPIAKRERFSATPE
jgi:hypothetical protein